MNTQRGVEVAGASVPAPSGATAPASSVGEVLRFAAYIADLIGSDRIEAVTWDAERPLLFVSVTETEHGETLARLLGLNARHDVREAIGSTDGFSCWEGRSGLVEMFLKAPLAPGALPGRHAHKRPSFGSADTAVT